MFKDQHQRKLRAVLWYLDQAARVCMKYYSIFMLMAKVMMHHHQQLPEDKHQVPRKDIRQLLLLYFLDPWQTPE